MCVCVPVPDNTPYLCQHTLSLPLILPVILCVTPPTMHKLSVIPTYTAYTCVFVCVCLSLRVCVCAYECTRPWMCIFSEPSQVVGSDASILLSSQLEVAISSPWKPVWGPNWQIDLHYFGCNFLVFLCLSFYVCICGIWVRLSKSVLFWFCWFHFHCFSQALLVAIFIITVFVKQENSAS